MNKFLRFWAPVFLWSAVIFVFSSLPTIKASQVFWREFLIKKSGHVIEYAVYAALIYRALTAYGVSKQNAGIIAILMALLYGVTDEVHQSYTPGREPKVRDVVFDTIGAIASIYSIWNLLPKAPRRLRDLARNLQLI